MNKYFFYQQYLAIRIMKNYISLFYRDEYSNDYYMYTLVSTVIS